LNPFLIQEIEIVCIKTDQKFYSDCCSVVFVNKNATKTN